jgi:hypothetical protein
MLSRSHKRSRWSSWYPTTSVNRSTSTVIQAVNRLLHFEAHGPVCGGGVSRGDGGIDQIVYEKQVAAILPGDYGALTASGTILFNPGVHTFDSVTLTDGARLAALCGEVQIRVKTFFVAGRLVSLAFSIRPSRYRSHSRLGKRPVYDLLQ